MKDYQDKAAESQAEMAKKRTFLAIDRTRLANERTFSAWIRTGVTGVGGGFAIHRFVTLTNIQYQKFLHLIAQLLILWGIGVFIFAFQGYLKSCKKLYKDEKQRTSLCGVTAVTVTIVLFSLALLLLTLISSR